MSDSDLFDFLMENESDGISTKGFSEWYAKFKQIADVLRTLGISKGEIGRKFWAILDKLDKNMSDLLTGVNAALDVLGLPPLDTLPSNEVNVMVESKAFRQLRNLIIKKLQRELKAKGHSEADINKAIDILEEESDRPFLDWLMNGGFEKLLEMILKIIALF